MARLIFAQVHQAVLGYKPGDVVEVDADDEVVSPYLAGKQLTEVDPDDVPEVAEDIVTDPPGLIPDVDLSAFANRGVVEDFARLHGVDLTGAKTRPDVERIVADERTRRADVAAEAVEAQGDVTAAADATSTSTTE